MLEKKIVTSEKQTVLNTDEVKKYAFPVNSKFFLNGKEYVVRKSYNDNLNEFRQVMAEGNEEIYMLTTLQSDSEKDPEFKVL